MRTAPVEARVTEFKAVSGEEVAKIIINMKTKQYELDTIPTHIIKEAVPQIKSALTKMVYISLQSVTFPKNMEDCISQVSDLKPNLDRIKASYRPVSNLKFLSKIVKCGMLHQFNEHCKQHNLIPDDQSAYRGTILVKLP